MTRWLLALLAIAGGVLLVRATGAPDASRVRARLTAAEALGGADTAGYALALRPRPFDFPADHGPHPDYRNEWWYITGHLRDPDGRRFGFQVTFFRSAVAPDTATLDSDWATRQLYMAHFAITDVEADRFLAFERFGRGALGLAGARPGPLRVWVDDWVLESDGARDTLFRLRAREGSSTLNLTLRQTRPPTLQGREGLSRKGPEPGNASYYYSLTRLAAAGDVVVDGRPYRVEGTAWMDREWGTSALGEDLVGWDWFALQLDDGRDLMFYRLRTADGRTGRADGSLVGDEGGVTPLGVDDVRLEALDTWTSPAGVDYPSGWRLTVPGEALELEIRPLVRDQELDLAFRYWEGAVAVEGTAEGRPLGGVGYVELTGYGDRAGGRDQPTAATSSSGADAGSGGSTSSGR